MGFGNPNGWVVVGVEASMQTERAHHSLHPAAVYHDSRNVKPEAAKDRMDLGKAARDRFSQCKSLPAEKPRKHLGVL